jgi:SAM-dependent methyltransferase
VTNPSWDDSYAGSVPPPWDIGQPQPAFVRLAEPGMLTGQLLDVGCGTGEHTLLAASYGADALGVDVSPLAIEQARGKAHAWVRGSPATLGPAGCRWPGHYGRTTAAPPAAATH